MKIKTIALLTIILGATTTVKADPLSLIFNVLTGGNRCNTPVYYDNQRYQPRYQPRYQQRDTFHEHVIHFDGDRFYKGAPPPDAYVYVEYPGPAPKHLYKDKSIQVQSYGGSHTICYRKPGW